MSESLLRSTKNRAFFCPPAGSSHESTMGESVICRMSEAPPSIPACGQHGECGHVSL